jgi:hypothetical protein
VVVFFYACWQESSVKTVICMVGSAYALALLPDQEIPMEAMKQIILQEMNEERYNRKHIDAKIRKAIEADADMQAKIDQGVALVQQYMAGHYYESKMKRIAQLQNMDIRGMVMDIFVGIAYEMKPELFTSVTAKLSARLGFSDRKEAIATVAELVAVLCLTDAFDIMKEDKMASLMLVSRIPLPYRVVDFIQTSEYLPPMVCEPLELTHNFSSGYLTHNDSLILGTGNHHDGDICLDVLNTMNKVALRLDTDFLSTVEEEPTFELDSQEKTDLWNDFKRQSYAFYSLMVQQGNQFYLTHKVDKRGRIYASGYHITTQGTAFKKASIELAREEIVLGAP